MNENGKKDRTEVVYEFICKYKDTHDGNSPTYREIARGVGVVSTSTVSHHINKLIEQGRLRQSKYGVRLLEVVR